MKKKLRTLRLLQGLSQDALAILSGVDRSTISRIEHGWIEPSERARKKLAAALKISECIIFQNLLSKDNE